MISVFDLKKLQDLLHDFYQITHIRITVFDEDYHELVAYPESLPPFCRIIRSCETGCAACAAQDQTACERAARLRTTQIYRCHAGLTEAITPIIVGEALVGYLLFGHVFSYPDREKGWQEIFARCKDLPLDLEELHRALQERPVIDGDYVRAATRILLAVASYLVLQKMAVLRTDQLAGRLDSYLTAHFTQDLTASHLCRTLDIGKTQLYKLSQSLYGCGIQAHIRSLRLACAKELLRRQPSLPLSEVAARCGYRDYNYFIAVFSRQEGCPPGAWRRQVLGQNPPEEERLRPSTAPFAAE